MGVLDMQANSFYGFVRLLSIMGLKGFLIGLVMLFMRKVPVRVVKWRTRDPRCCRWQRCCSSAAEYQKRGKHWREPWLTSKCHMRECFKLEVSG